MTKNNTTEWWNRAEMEAKLQKEVTTLVQLTEMFPPKNSAELFAVTIPNLITFVYHELAQARLQERKDTLESVRRWAEAEGFANPSEAGQFKMHAHGYNQALDDLLTHLTTLEANPTQDE